MRGGAEGAMLGDTRAWLGRFLIVATGIGLAVFVIAVVAWPWLEDAFTERMLLPQREGEFGFRVGRIARGEGDSRLMVRALVVVTPGGKMAAAGARDCDIVLGGWRALYGAVEAARAGEAADFSVLGCADWPNFSKRRRVVLHEGSTAKPPASCETVATETR